MNTKNEVNIKSIIIINLKPWEIIISLRHLAIAIYPDTRLRGNRLSSPQFSFLQSKVIFVRMREIWRS